MRRLLSHAGLVLSLAFFFALGLGAAPRHRVAPEYLAPPAQLDTAAGEAVLQRFRQQGLSGDYSLDFTLRHFPRTGPEHSWQGRLWGTWSLADGPTTRCEINRTDDTPALALIVRSGARPQLWLHGADDTTAALHAPLAPGLTFTPFDLQMPFVYWTDHAYEGTRKVKGRPAHFFLLYPPEGDPRYRDIAGVRVVLDAEFNILLRAETLDGEGQPLKTFQIQSFKKVSGQWMVRTIDLIDARAREKTRFEVQAAALGLRLPAAIFAPGTLDTSPEDPAEASFVELR